MCPTYSFECKICGEYFEEWYHIADMPDELPCPCGAYAERIIAYAPALQSTQMDGNFKPYYDDQLAEHFQTADEKKKWLKDNDYVQVSGPLCPQKDLPGNFQCTQGQSKAIKPPKSKKKAPK